MCLTAVTSFENAAGNMETSHRRILRRYLRSWFMLDLPLILVGWTLIVFGESLKSIAYMNLFRLLRLPRIQRVIDCIVDHLHLPKLELLLKLLKTVFLLV